MSSTASEQFSFFAKDLIAQMNMDYTTLSDEELLKVLQKTPDYKKLVFPTTWHKKFQDLPVATCSDTKEFLRESPWMKRAYVYYEDRGKVHDIGPQPGGVRPILPAPEVPTVTLIQNSFSDGPTNQTADEHLAQTAETTVNSTTPSDSKTQE